MSGRLPRTTPREHGWVKYKREGCRCQICSDDNRRRGKQLVYLRETGQSRYVDAAPVREHVQQLLDQGMTYPQIGLLAGVDRSLVRVLHRGHVGKPPSRRVRRETAAALLALSHDPAAVPAGAKVDATGTRRRVQALLAEGWTQGEITARLGNRRYRGLQIARAPMVLSVTALAVRALYDDLAGKGGPNPSSARRYQRLGYLPSGWWDPENIDDPTYEPPTQDTGGDVDPVAVQRAVDGDPPISLTRDERVMAVLELRDRGLSLREIAERIDVNPRQVSRDLSAHSEQVA